MDTHNHFTATTAYVMDTNRSNRNFSVVDGMHLPLKLVCISLGSDYSGCEFLLVWLGAIDEVKMNVGAGESPQSAMAAAVACWRNGEY